VNPAIGGRTRTVGMVQLAAQSQKLTVDGVACLPRRALAICGVLIDEGLRGCVRHVCCKLGIARVADDVDDAAAVSGDNPQSFLEPVRCRSLWGSGSAELWPCGEVKPADGLFEYGILLQPLSQCLHVEAAGIGHGSRRRAYVAKVEKI